MIIKRYQTGQAFLEQAEAFLEQAEAVNGLSLAVAHTPDPVKPTPFFSTVMDGDDLVCTAVMSPPFPLLLSNGLNSQSCSRCHTISRDIPDAFALIAQELYREGISVSGVLAKSELSHVFAILWKQITQQDVHVEKDMTVYELRQVRPTPPCPGTLCPATESDIPLVTHWGKAFNNDVGFSDDDDVLEARVRRDIEASIIFLWKDGEPVSMVRRARATRNGIAVNFVYTPPEFRRKGYATACVAEMSQRLLDSGFQFCTLFADTTNPTANGIYQRIGYQALADFSQYEFEEGSLS